MLLTLEKLSAQAIFIEFGSYPVLFKNINNGIYPRVMRGRGDIPLNWSENNVITDINSKLNIK